MQKVNSAYTKTVDPVNFVLDSDILYADKNRTGSLLRSVGFTVPTVLLGSDSVGTITYVGNSVKLDGKNARDVIRRSNSDRSTMEPASPPILKMSSTEYQLLC